MKTADREVQNFVRQNGLPNASIAIKAETFKKSKRIFTHFALFRNYYYVHFRASVLPLGLYRN